MKNVIRLSSIMILLSPFFWNCSSDSRRIETDHNYIEIYLDSLCKKDLISENTRNCKFVKLETNDYCLIQSIVKIEFDDKRIFVRDSNNKLFVFDERGTYLNMIGKIGSAPDELLSLIDFCVNKEDKTVNVLDIYKSSLYIYSYDGKLLKIDKFSDRTFSNTSKIAHLQRDLLLLTQDNDHASLFNYRILNTTNKKTKDLLPFLAVGDRSIAFGMPKVSKMKASSLLCAFLSDTIYRYDSNEENVVAKYVLKKRERAAVKEIFEKERYEIALDAFLTAQKKNVSSGIHSLYSTSRYICFTTTMGKSECRIFFDAKLNKGYCFEIQPTDGLASFNGLLATTDDAFVCAVDAESLLSERFSGNNDLSFIRDATHPDDNPVLIYYYFK